MSNIESSFGGQVSKGGFALLNIFANLSHYAWQAGVHFSLFRLAGQLLRPAAALTPET